MNKDEFQREMVYQATMSIFRKMLSESQITREEYNVIDTNYLKKCAPIFGSLLSRPEWQ